MDFKQGDKVRKCKHISQDAINWGACADTNLLEDKDYFVERVDVHSWHTKIKLYNVDGLFNSVTLEKVK